MIVWLLVCLVVSINCVVLYVINCCKIDICDRPWENRPSSHLGMIVEIPVLKVVISIPSFARVRLALLSRIVFIDKLNLI